MRGLTTTFFSDKNDKKNGDLYLGAFQRAFAQEEGIIHVATMHHTPDWLIDHDDLDEALSNYCSLSPNGA